MSDEFLSGEVRALGSRGISEETCRKYNYRVGKQRDGRTVQIAEHRDEEGLVVAQHLRTADKDFPWIGSARDARLWGKHLWKEGGKRVVVTEGEVDCMSLAQCLGLTWPVVSLPGGADGAKKAIQRDLEWLESFDQVILAFDMDEPGRKAVAACAPLFTPGKCSVMELPVKDANDMLKAGKVKELVTAFWQARVYRPGGIVNGADVWDRVTEADKPGIPYPWAGLTAKTLGQKPGTLITWTAGTGCGKSTVVSQVAYELAFVHGLKVGYVALEESVGRAAQRFMSHYLGKQTHITGAATPEELRTAFDATLGTGRVWLLDHFGSSDADGLLSKLRYLAKGCDVNAIVLDHISIAISGLGVDGDDRKLLDFLMTALRTLAEECGITLHVISHLRRIGDDKGHEEGARVSLSHLRGSGAIAQLSDVVVALERDLQKDGAMTCRILKNRPTGETGVVCRLAYERASGRLTEVHEEETEGPFGEDHGEF